MGVPNNVNFEKNYVIKNVSKNRALFEAALDDTQKLHSLDNFKEFGKINRLPRWKSSEVEYLYFLIHKYIFKIIFYNIII